MMDNHINPSSPDTNDVDDTSSNSTRSQERADVNRRNAAHSTGPRTEEGKARSSQNARRNGWFAGTLLVEADRQETFSAFEQAWLAELQPEGLLELESFHHYLRAAWHIREIIEAQNQHSLSGPSAFLNPDTARTLDRLHRYERDFERRAARHLRELRRLQTERAARSHVLAAKNAILDAPPPLAAAASLIPTLAQQKRSQLEPSLNLAADLLRSVTNHLNVAKPTDGPIEPPRDNPPPADIA